MQRERKRQLQPCLNEFLHSKRTRPLFNVTNYHNCKKDSFALVVAVFSQSFGSSRQ